MKNFFCSECGTRYQFSLIGKWPKKCLNCDHVNWRNPKPVVAVLQPVIKTFEHGDAWGRPYEVGLAIAKRAIQPMKGEWSLIGGFMENGETLEQAAAREFREETSLATAAMPTYLFSAPVGANHEQVMLMTYIDKAMPFEVFKLGRPCPENEELGVLWSGSSVELAFPTHREAAKMFFAGEVKWRV